MTSTTVHNRALPLEEGCVLCGCDGRRQSQKDTAESIAQDNTTYTIIVICFKLMQQHQEGTDPGCGLVGKARRPRPLLHLGWSEKLSRNEQMVAVVVVFVIVAKEEEVDNFSRRSFLD